MFSHVAPVPDRERQQPASDARRRALQRHAVRLQLPRWTPYDPQAEGWLTIDATTRTERFSTERTVIAAIQVQDRARALSRVRLYRPNGSS